MSRNAQLLAAATGLNLATRLSRNVDYWSKKLTYTPSPYPAMSYRPRYRSRRYRPSGRSHGGFNTGPRFQGSVPARSLRPQLKFSSNDTFGHDFSVTDEDDTLLVQIPAGDAPSQRDGRIIRLMNLRGQVVYPSGQDSRLVIYTPLDPTDTISLPNTGDAVDPERFKVWYDNYWYSSGTNRDKQINLNFGRYGHKIHYDGTASTDTIRGPVRIYQNQPGAAGNSRGHFIATFVDT